MTPRHRLKLLFSVVTVTLLAGGFLLPKSAWGADTGNPTPAPTSSPPTVTIVIATPESTQLVPVTAVPELSTPQGTSIGPVIAPTLQVAATSMPIPTATRLPTSTSSRGPASPSGAPTGVESPWPSPAQLRLNARLRWGGRLPASVRRWAFLIIPAAQRYHLNPNLIAAVMTMESGGDPLALSRSDARGLMQILHGPWDPKQNVFTGARMLADLIGQFHDVSLALAAYNAGPGAVETYGGVPPYRETRDYVVIVRYLFDLYNHHSLSQSRRKQYKATLKDLHSFADQRKKIHVLARAAHVKADAIPTCDTCDARAPVPKSYFSSDDPFWPVAGMPDPLQRVAPDVIVR